MRSAPLIRWPAIICIILTATSAVPLTARAASAPLGFIVHAIGGNGRADVAGTGSAIYAGDRLKTDDNEKLQARLGDWQIYLASKTLAEVGGLRDDPSVTLISGTIVISSPDRQTFRLQADGLTILPPGTQGAGAKIIWKYAHALEVASRSGGLQLSTGGEVQTIQRARPIALRLKLRSRSRKALRAQAAPRRQQAKTISRHT
jgi:hypothetical protein